MEFHQFNDLEAHVERLKPANDSRPVMERLRDYAQRGMDAPGSLTPNEVGQLAFALAVTYGWIG